MNIQPPNNDKNNQTAPFLFLFVSLPTFSSPTGLMTHRERFHPLKSVRFVSPVRLRRLQWSHLRRRILKEISQQGPHVVQELHLAERFPAGGNRFSRNAEHPRVRVTLRRRGRQTVTGVDRPVSATRPTGGVGLKGWGVRHRRGAKCFATGFCRQLLLATPKLSESGETLVTYEAGHQTWGCPMQWAVAVDAPRVDTGGTSRSGSPLEVRRRAKSPETGWMETTKRRETDVKDLKRVVLFPFEIQLLLFHIISS